MVQVTLSVIIELIKEYYDDPYKKWFLPQAFRGAEGKNNPFFSDAFVACGGKLNVNGNFKSKSFKKDLKNRMRRKFRTMFATRMGPEYKEFLDENLESRKTRTKVIA